MSLSVYDARWINPTNEEIDYYDKDNKETSHSDAALSLMVDLLRYLEHDQLNERERHTLAMLFRILKEDSHIFLKHNPVNNQDLNSKVDNSYWENNFDSIDKRDKKKPKRKRMRKYGFAVAAAGKRETQQAKESAFRDDNNTGEIEEGAGNVREENNSNHDEKTDDYRSVYKDVRSSSSSETRQMDEIQRELEGDLNELKYYLKKRTIQRSRVIPLQRTHRKNTQVN